MSGKILFGPILIFIGASAITQQLFDFNLARYWSVLLIFAGIAQLLQRGRSMFGGIFTIAIGSLFLLGSLDVLDGEYIGLLIPVVLVLAGIYVMLPKPKKAPGNTSQSISYTAILGGAGDTVQSQDFTGGTISAFMGGADIDLRDAQIDGDQAVINATAIMGGITLKVPKSWQVQFSGLPLMGGWDNKTQLDSKTKKPKKLILQTTAIMGGVEVTN